MHRSMILAVTGLLVVGCSVRGPSIPPSTPSPTVGPRTEALASATPSASAAAIDEPLPSNLDPKILHAIDMRKGAGLRHDLAYVLAAETDPAAKISLFDFPTYPEEDEQVLRDQSAGDVIVAAIQSYAAAHESSFGGLYIDREDMPGTVVALWTDDLAAHETAIRARVGDTRFFAVRKVRYSHAELRELQDEVVKDWRAKWVKDIPAVFQGVGVDIIENALFIEISSANPEAPAIIAAHYDLGDRLRIESDGTGAALIPVGWVKGMVVTQDGQDPGENDLMLDAVSEAPGGCGGGDIGFGISSDGSFEYPCQAGVRTIRVLKNVAEGEWVSIGEVTVEVKAGTTVSVTIPLTEAP